MQVLPSIRQELLSIGIPSRFESHGARNPRLSMAWEVFLAEKSKLDLPGSVRLSPDPFFERLRLRVEFDVNSAFRFVRL